MTFITFYVAFITFYVAFITLRLTLTQRIYIIYMAFCFPKTSFIVIINQKSKLDQLLFYIYTKIILNKGLFFSIKKMFFSRKSNFF